MAKLIKERERVATPRHELNFYTKDTNEVRFGFPITNGTIIPLNFYGEQCSESECYWWKNYLFAKANEDLYAKEEHYNTYGIEPAIALCECGKEIYLNYDAEECPYCGRLHNLSGQELLPRKYWEEDWDYEY